MSLSGLVKKWKTPPVAMYRCDTCFTDIYEGDRRYCCVECVKSYDLCSKCCKAGKDREHAKLLGSDHQFTVEQRSAKATFDLVKGTSLEKTVRNWFLYYDQQHALGSYDSATNTYHYITYQKVGQLVRDFASGVKHLVKGHNNVGDRREKKKGSLEGKMVSVCGPACLEWYVADFAFLLLGMVNAPITVTADQETIEYVLKLTEAEIVVCAPRVLETILSITSGAKTSVSTIIVMDKTCPIPSPAVWNGALAVVRFPEVLAIGNKHQISNSKWNQYNHGSDNIFTIVFTSGSTGQPKGCVFSRDTWNKRMTRISSHVGLRRVWLSYHPPSHNLDRTSVYSTLNVGGKVAFYRGSMEHLLDDYALVRPTIIAGTPRFWNMIYNKYLQAVQAAYKEHLIKPQHQTQQEQDGGIKREKELDTVKDETGAVVKDETGAEVCIRKEDGENSLVEDVGHESHDHSGVITVKEGKIENSHSEQIVHPQLSHLSSFDGEDTDRLDEELEQLEISSGDNPLHCSHITTSDTATACAVTSHQDVVTFNIERVPHEVKFSVMEQFKFILGGREIAVVTGGAPTSDTVKRFIMNCFGGIPSEGYGATEVGAIASNGRMHSINEFKLLDVPEMGYFTTDNPPRGELCVKTPTMVSGYYKNEQEMKDKFIDGYFRTGDIVVLEGKDSVRIIDRKKNLFKLAQGEFVSPEKLETVYTVGSSMINQMYIYGNSLQSNVVGVVVPHSESLQKWWAEHHLDSEDILVSYEDLCQRKEVESLYMLELSNIATTHSLQGWEVPAGILVEPTPFSSENGLLTSIEKKSRPRLEKRYGSALEKLYDKINANKDTRPLEIQVIEYLLSRAHQHMADPVQDSASIPSYLSTHCNTTITELGGDSLTAMRLSGLLKEHFSVEIPAQFILTHSFQQLLQIISPQKRQNEDPFEKSALCSVDWDEETSIDFLESYSEQEKAVFLRNESKVTVLLTGATGFLGRFILLDLLQSAVVNKVYCIVKGKDDVSPSKRVAVILSQICAELSVDGSFQHKLDVMGGDLSQERLGLSAIHYSTLCSCVDIIIHNGAVVNAALPYASLKAVNVDGTKEVLKIVCEGRPKFLHYVSTMGVFSGHSGPITEDTLPTADRRSGYAQSKWAGEAMVRKALEQRIIKGSISRPGLIGAHSATGHANLQDWVCWLVRGVAKLGYFPVGPGCDDKMIFCVPVEQIVQAILFFSLKYQGSRSVFHLVNNSSPLSYSALGDAIKAFLHPTLKTCDYAEFRSHLSSLAHTRGDSVLSSLDMLLPQSGGWTTSRAHSNTATQLATGAEVRLNSLPSGYLDKYITFIGNSFP